MNSEFPNHHQEEQPSSLPVNTDDMEMIPCSDCGHWVPRMNMAIHQAHACRGSGSAAAVPSSTPRTLTITTTQDTSSSTEMTTTETSQSSSVSAALPITSSSPGIIVVPSVPVVQGQRIANQHTHNNQHHHQNHYSSTTAMNHQHQNHNHHPQEEVIDLTLDDSPMPIASKNVAQQQPRNNRRSRMIYDELDYQEEEKDHNDSEEMEDSKIPAQSAAPQQHETSSSFVEEDNEPSLEQWTCPRCTLLNAITDRVCDACQFWNPNPAPHNPNDATATVTTTTTTTTSPIRSPDPVRNERLIIPNHDHPDHRHTDTTDPLYSSPLRYVSGGAVLGGMLGATGAYLRGEPISHSAVVSGALSGAMGGALYQSLYPTNNNNNNTTNPNATTTSSSGGANCNPTTTTTTTHTPTSATTSTVRSTGNGGVQRTTVRRGPFGSTIITYSSSSYGGGGGGGGRPHHQQNQSFGSSDSSSFGGGGNRNIPNPMMTATDPQMTMMMTDPMEIWRHVFLANGRLGGIPGGYSSSTAASAVDGMSYDQLLQLFGDGTEHMGADEATIRRMPVSIVHNELPEDCRVCQICLEPFQISEQRMILPCLHGFHRTCAEKWLRTNASCPVCKHKIQE